MPNPFRGTVFLSLEVPTQVSVEVRVYDVQGAGVCRLHHGELSPGSNQFTWDGRNDDGERVSSGIYFAEAVAGGQRTRIRLVKVPE